MENNKRLYGINGIRAIAIIAVILYHMDVKVLSGGFLGVNLFFVLSGYLVMSSLKKKYTSNRDLNIGSLFFDKIKKFIPLMYMAITLTLIYMVLFNKYMLAKSFKDSWASYIFQSNWWYIIQKIDYFDKFSSISPFKHLWYMGVLVQAILILIISFVLFNKNQSKKRLNSNYINFIIGIIVASLLLHVFLYNPENVNRVYYGTDTRIFSIFFGAVTALIYPINNFGRKLTSKQNIILTGISIISICVFIYLTRIVLESDSILYRGGFFAIDVLSMIIIISSCHSNSWIYKLLSFKPISYIGEISYGLYLWHFPVFVLTRPSSEIGYPNYLFYLIRIIISILLTIGSQKLYDYIVKNEFFSRKNVKSLFKNFNSTTKKVLAYSTAVFVFVLFSMGISGLAMPFTSTLFAKDETFVMKRELKTRKKTEVGNNKNTPPPSKKVDVRPEIKQKNDSKDNIEKKVSEKEKLEKEKLEKERLEREKAEKERLEKEKAEKEKEKFKSDNKTSEPPYKKLLLIGDSLAINFGEALLEKYPNAVVDAQISRQLYYSYEVAESYSYMDSKNTMVILQLGTNGIFSIEQMDDLLAYFPNSDIYFINIRTPDALESRVNETIAENIPNHKNLTLVDWYSFSEGKEEYFEPDNTHLNFDGAEALLSLVEKVAKRPIKLED
ncbi:MAG: acyltransferase family protein [Tissierellia bacterium]|nr:acyltransferase family protein [Tissierellia bacterium]